MKTPGLSLGLFSAPVLCLFWLTKHAVDSVQLSAPDVITGAYGGSVEVACQYDPQFRVNQKYWCKGKIYELCEIVVETPEKRPKGRFSIADDKEARVFTVTMTSLRESDEDTYWCAITRSGRDVNIDVKLRVTHTVIAIAPSTTTILEPDQMSSWWATLRWILFVLLLSCLVSTHVAVWRIAAAGKKLQPFQNQNSNIYN